jgi:hypothetical protein
MANPLNIRIVKDKEIVDSPADVLPNGMSREDWKDEYNKRIQLSDKLLEQKQTAKYKLELFLGKARSMTKPVPGMLSFWESGSQLHGGGDAKVYICPGKHIGKNECEAVIPFALNAYGFCVCNKCGEAWDAEKVIGEVFGRHSMRQWSELLMIYMRKLDMNCDIYLKHSPDDIRSVAMREQEHQHGGELLAKARKRALHIYPMSHIIKDTSAGADLTNRIFTFLTA